MLLPLVRPARAAPAARSSRCPIRCGSARVVHAALHRLYREAPGADSIPRPGDVRRWSERFAELLEEEVEPPARGRQSRPQGRAGAGARPRSRPSSSPNRNRRPRCDRGGTCSRSGSDSARARTARISGADEPDPLRLGEIALRGRIDRIDVSPDGRTALLPRLQDLAQGRRGEAGSRRRQAADPALHAGDEAAARARPGRRPLPAAGSDRRSVTAAPGEWSATTTI